MVSMYNQEEAFEESQKYKEGKFILEKVQLKKDYWMYQKNNRQSMCHAFQDSIVGPKIQ